MYLKFIVRQLHFIGKNPKLKLLTCIEIPSFDLAVIMTGYNNYIGYDLKILSHIKKPKHSLPLIFIKHKLNEITNNKIG